MRKNYTIKEYNVYCLDLPFLTEAVFTNSSQYNNGIILPTSVQICRETNQDLHCCAEVVTAGDIDGLAISKEMLYCKTTLSHNL